MPTKRNKYLLCPKVDTDYPSLQISLRAPGLPSYMLPQSTASLKLATPKQQLPQHPPIKRSKDSKNFRVGKKLPSKSKDNGRFDKKFRQIDRYGCEFKRDSGVLYTLYNIKRGI